MNRTELENTIADRLDLCGEPMPGVPIVEIAGDSRVLIERHRGISEYENKKIGVLVSYGHVIIEGENLTLLCMTREQLVISGRIFSVTIRRR